MSGNATGGVCIVAPPPRLPAPCQTVVDCPQDDDPCSRSWCEEGIRSDTSAFGPGTVCHGNGERCSVEVAVECRAAADCPPDPTGCNEIGCTDGRCVST